MSSDAAEWIPLFPEEEVGFILEAILRCGSRLRKLHDTEREDELSDRLRDLLDRDSGLRSRPVEICRELPLYDRARSGQRQLGRVDLVFLYSTGIERPWPYFAVEAKRLHVRFLSGWQSLISEYVTGGQGMMCFIDERYGRGLNHGGMLGYVFDGNVQGARSAIGSAIENNRERVKSAGAPGFAPSAFVDGRVHESGHLLSAGLFRIYHIFIAV